MKVAVIGTGAFGYAIADKLNSNGHDVIMWSDSEEKYKDIKNKKITELIPGKKIAKRIKFTASYETALDGAQIVFIMTAAKYVDSVTKGMKPYITKDMHFCVGSKGIEQGTGRFVHQVFEDNIRTRKLSIISGPTFAIDIVNNEPVAFSIAGKCGHTKDVVIKALSSSTLKLRKSSDMIGLELCGSIKNVIAIASGIIGGLGYSDGTRSFLIVESMHDIKALSKALGGKRKTVLTYGGIGDLLMTCTSLKSRNYTYGQYLGKKDFKGAEKYLETTTVEGYFTLQSIYALLRKKKIKMPVVNLIYDIVFKGKDPDSLIQFLIKK